MTPSVTQYFHAPTDKYLNSDIYVTWAGHRYCEPTHNVGPRVMNSYKLVFVINGKGFIEYGTDKPMRTKQGDLMVIYPKQRHHYYADPDDPWELMWVCINGEYCRDILSDIGINGTRNIYHNAATPAVQRTLLTIINSLGNTDDSLRLVATGEMYILLSYLTQIINKQKHAPEHFRHDDAVLKAIRFIEENYHLNIDVNMLCHHVNYSRSYLSRLFRSETGMTIPEYTSKVRVEHAKVLLTDTNIPMREVATSVGINDPFYFSKIFKSVAGQSPSSYRAEYTGTRKDKSDGAQPARRISHASGT